MDEVREEQASRLGGGSRCLMCTTIESWTGQDARDLAEALADRTIYASTIIAALKARGVEATDNQVGNHRRKHV